MSYTTSLADASNSVMFHETSSTWNWRCIKID